MKKYFFGVLETWGTSFLGNKMKYLIFIPKKFGKYHKENQENEEFLELKEKKRRRSANRHIEELD